MVRWPLILFATLALNASTGDISGSWKAVVTGGVIHMTIAQALFDFHVVDGNRLTGTAEIGDYYPGAAPITQGTIDGDHFSFTVVGEHPSSNGLPTMKFTGTLHGDELELTMDLVDGYVDGGKTEMKARRN
jgi:hypothetical protein